MAEENNDAGAVEMAAPVDQAFAEGAAAAENPKPKKTGGCCGSMCNSMLCFDMFGKKAELTLPSGKTSYNTFTGCMCSLLVVGIVGLFGAALVRDKVLDERSRYQMESVEREYFSLTDPYKIGDAVAFGVVDPEFPTEEMPANVGTVGAYLRSWDYTWGSPTPVYTALATAPCTEEQLGAMYAASPNSVDLLGKYKANLHCLTDPEVSLLGSSMSMSGSQLVFLIEGCSESCASDIENQMNGKYMLFYNGKERTFIPPKDSDDENNFTESSRFTMFPISQTMHGLASFSFKQGRVDQHNDILRPFHDFDSTEDDVMWMSGPTFGGFLDNVKPNQLAGIALERDLDLYMTEIRLENSGFEMAGLVGGLAVVTFLLFFVLDHCWTMPKFKNYMASELYHAAPEEMVSMSSKRGMVGYSFWNEIHDTDGKPLNLNRVTCWHRIFCCCTRGRRLFSEARKLTGQELNVASIVKAQRESKAAMEILKGKFGDEADQLMASSVARVVTLKGD